MSTDSNKLHFGSGYSVCAFGVSGLPALQPYFTFFNDTSIFKLIAFLLPGQTRRPWQRAFVSWLTFIRNDGLQFLIQFVIVWTPFGLVYQER